MKKAFHKIHNDILRYCLSITTLLCVYISTCANNSLRIGYVNNENGEAIEKAVVYVVDSLYKTLKYTYTDNKGSFTFDSVPESARFVIVRALGHSNDTTSLSMIGMDPVVYLYKKSTVLNEVVVKAKRGYQNGDTLNYFVNSLMNDGDKVISDVIKKIPGIDVLDDGQILYNGKPISEFKVEDLNLSGGRYTQISNNLKAVSVSKIQILQNNQPIKLLKDIKFSDNVSINLELKEEYKNVWQFGVDLGLGESLQKPFGLLGDSKAMLLSFGKKMQSFSLYKFNNSGKDVLKELNDEDADQLGEKNGTGLISPTTFFSPDLEYTRTRFNTSNILASNWIFKIAKNADIRINVGGYLDKNKNTLHKTTKYLDIEDTPQVTVCNSINGDDNEFFTEIHYKLNSESVYIEESASFQGIQKQFRGDLDLNFIEHRESNSLSERTIHNKFRMLKKVFRENLIDLNADFSYTELPESLIVSDLFCQHDKQHFTKLSLYSTYRQRLRNFDIPLKVNYNYQRQSVMLDLTKDNLNNSTSWNEYSNVNEIYTIGNISFTPGLEYSLTKLKLWLHCCFSFQHKKLIKNFDDEVHRNRIIASPNIGLALNPNSKIRMGVSYNYSRQPANLRDFLGLTYFINSSSARQSSEKIYDTKVHSGYAYCNYLDILSGWSASITYSLSNISGLPIVGSRLDDNVCVTYNLPIGSNLTTHFFGTRVGKMVDFCNIDINIKPDFFCSSTKTYIVDNVYPQITNGLTIKGNVSIQPASWIEIRWGSSFLKTWNYIYFSGIIKTQNSILKNKLYISSFFKNFILKWNTELINPIHDVVPGSLFSDLSIEYRKKNYSVSCELTNIFGKKQYEQQLLENTRICVLSSPLRARSLLLKFSYDF